MKQPFDSYDTRIASLLQIYKSYLLCTQHQANIHNHLHQTNGKTMDGISLSRYFCNTVIAKNPNFQPPTKKYVIIQKKNSGITVP